MCSRADGWFCVGDEKSSQGILFRENTFFGKADKDLIEAWLEQLTNLGWAPSLQLDSFLLRYQFPPLANGTKFVELGKKYGNCRVANIDVGVDKYRPEENKLADWADNTLNGFGEILDWCESSDGMRGLHREPGL